jgi:hypothetical protein
MPQAYGMSFLNKISKDIEHNIVKTEQNTTNN